MKNNIAIAVAYYTALGKKDLEEVKHYLHPHIHFTDPQEQVIGKETVLKAATGFSTIFKSLVIRAAFSDRDQAVIIYDVEIPNFANKNLRAASWLSFQEGLISKIELIYDTQCFMEKKEKVLSL